MSLTYHPEPVTVRGFIAAKLEMRGEGTLTIVSGKNVVRITSHPDGTVNVVDSKTGQALHIPGK